MMVRHLLMILRTTCQRGISRSGRCRSEQWRLVFPEQQLETILWRAASINCGRKEPKPRIDRHLATTGANSPLNSAAKLRHFPSTTTDSWTQTPPDFVNSWECRSRECLGNRGKERGRG